MSFHAEPKMNSESDSVLYLMKAFDPWNFEGANSVQEFFDPLQKRIIFLKQGHVYVFEQYFTNKDNNPLYFKIPIKDNKVDALAISHDDKYLAFYCPDLSTYFIDYTNSKYPREVKISFSSNSKIKRILGITFCRSPNLDFIILHGAGFEVYKYYLEKSQLKNIKSVVFPIYNFWFEPHNSILLISSSAAKGLLQPFFFTPDDKSMKFIKGKPFQLDISDKESIEKDPREEDKEPNKFKKISYEEKRDLFTRNLKKINLEEENKPNMHRLLLCQIYGKSALLHYNPHQGKIFLYRLEYEKIQRHLLNIKTTKGADAKCKFMIIS